MKHVQNRLLVAALLATLGLAAVAQTPPPPPAGGPGAARMEQRMGGHQMMGRSGSADPAKMQTRMAERHAARMAVLKMRLQITPAQEGAWTTFASALQPKARAMAERQQLRAEMEKLTTPERIDRMQALKTTRQTEMSQRGDAVKAFYTTLSADQKKLFDKETLRHGQMGERGGRHGGPDMGHRMMGHGMGHGAGPATDSPRN